MVPRVGGSERHVLIHQVNKKGDCRLEDVGEIGKQNVKASVKRMWSRTKSVFEKNEERTTGLPHKH
jgi:hypothetical protein